MGRLSGAAAGLLIGFGLLAALEIGTRVIAPVEFPPDPLIAEDQTWWGEERVYDPLLFWKPRPNKGDEFRILSLGESTTFGTRVAYRDTYSAQPGRAPR